MATKSAKKTNEKMWKRIVSSVKSGSAGGRPGQWSARKAQIATKRYKKRVVGTKVLNHQVTVYLNGQNRNGIMSAREMKKSQELREVVIYLNQLGKVSVPQSVRLPIGRSDKLLPRVSKKLSIVKK